jgi:hypothetical protein
MDPLVIFIISDITGLLILVGMVIYWNRISKNE